MQNNKYANEPSGRKLYVTKKSSRSWIVVPIPNGVISLRILKPRAQGKDKIKIIIKLTGIQITLEQVDLVSS